MMKRNTGIARWTTIIGMFLIGAVYASESKAIDDKPHSFSTGECTLCHDNAAAGPSLSAVDRREDIHPACDNCHGACEPWGTHANQQLAGRKVIVELPAADGKIVCITCHDPHPENVPGLTHESPNLRITNLKRELCLNCHIDRPDHQWRVEIAAPPSGAVVHDRHVPLLGRAEALPESYLQVRINGAAFPLKVDRGAFHTRLTLQEGMNVVEISFRGEQLWRGELFHSSGEAQGTSYVKTFYGHQTGSLQECLSCHGNEEGTFRTDVRNGSGLCYQCHEEFDEKRYLHGPLAVGECHICHDPHGGIGPNHLNAEETKLCRSCHDDRELHRRGGGRDALADGSCSSCHDPHQSDGRFLMKQALL